MQNSAYDVVVVGGGFAGLTAAVYCTRDGLKTAVVSGETGGQILTASDVENYPGIVNVSGAELSENLVKQAEKYGAVLLHKSAKSVSLSGNEKTVDLSDAALTAKSVIIATGASPKKAGFTGENEFCGKGVSYCAACDGFFYKNRKAVVIGGGNSAVQEALSLSEICSEVVVAVRRDVLRCDGSLEQRIRKKDNVVLNFNTVVSSVDGEDFVRLANFADAATGRTTTYTADDGGRLGVFVMVGRHPETELFAGSIELDEHGYVPADETTRTSVKGVFAAGDVRRKAVRQLVTAASDGASAAHFAAEYVRLSKN